MARTEAGDAGKLLVLLDESLSFAGDIRRRDFHLDLPLGAAAGFSGAHVYLSRSTGSSEAVPNSNRPNTTGVQS
jgi:hypothetical protein